MLITVSTTQRQSLFAQYVNPANSLCSWSAGYDSSTALDWPTCSPCNSASKPGGLASAPSSIDTAIPFSESKKRIVDHFERSYLLRALRENDGNVSRTANSIGMVRQSLQQKIRELDLRSEDWSNGDKG